MPVVGLFYSRERRDDGQYGHCFINRAADDQADRYGNTSGKQVLVAVFPAAFPVELAPIEFVTANDGHVAPGRAQESRNDLVACQDTGKAEEADKDAGHAQEYGDNRTGIDQAITALLGAVMTRDSSPNWNTRANAGQGT